ncbi:MAG: polysaccharide deacetylase family protein [Endomicrobiales bacterium]|nr:polysaccharide deacetylase family protein [Endomicrobiales bacterium]
MFKVRLHLVVYRYEIILAFIILILTGSIAVSSRDNERAFPPVQRYPYKIAITFDDGPHQKYTKELLAFLKKYNIKATFFVVGDQVIKYPQLARLISLYGHEIENHTTTHPNLTKLPEKNIKEELVMTRELIKNIAEQKSKYFRPPGGHYDNKVIEVAKDLGLRMVLWTVFPKDHGNTQADIISERILEQAHDGGVILLHSGSKQTLEALPKVIKELRYRGYHFVTISQLHNSNKEKELVWLK